MQHDTPITLDLFPTDVAGLPDVRAPEAVELAEGDSFELTIGPVANHLGEATVRMLAYGGSIPGPTLRVQQDSTVTIDVRNEGDLDATVHWHGLRLDNRYDGTHETQPPIPVGGEFSYQLTFPDPGIYWYHPHIRQDYGQEMGLYGTIVVKPKDRDYWPPADREVVLTVDDILVEEGQITPFHRNETTFSAMGRYGNVFLVNGDTDLSLSAQAGEVVRFFIVNTANSRVFNVAVPGAAMKLVGGDSGRVEHEALVEGVILAPSERVVVDVRLEGAGEYVLEHQTPERSYRLARLVVDETPARNGTHDQFSALRSAPELEAERAAIASHLSAAPDKTLALVAEMDVGSDVEIGTLCACPMHPDIVASWAGQCPRCGMKLLPAVDAAAELMTLACPMHPDVTASWEATCPKCGMTLRPGAGGGEAAVHHHAGHDMSSHSGHAGSEAHDGLDDHAAHHHADGHGNGHEAHSHGHGGGDGIEWEDDMLEVNRTTTTANTLWKIVDRDTGAAGHDISWKFRVGDRVKIRIINEPESDHPMHHPFHIHGAGRFLVLARDGVAQENLVWKDTVLLRMGETVDILLDVTNPGRWMAHCHIAEHHESGMMFSFDVVEGNGSSPEAQ